MSIGPSTTRAVLESTIEVDLVDRWEALSLCEALVPFHSFLVQHSAALWVVHAKVPGCSGQSLSDALDVIDDWRAERAATGTVRVGPERIVR